MHLLKKAKRISWVKRVQCEVIFIFFCTSTYEVSESLN